MDFSVATPRPRWGLGVASLLFPVLKCAICPACLSVLGGLFAGAGIGFLQDGPWHGALVAVVLVMDYWLLRVATQHHHNPWPLRLCLLGAALAVLGHLSSEVFELVGFGVLMLASVHNLLALRRHRRAGGNCCEDAVQPRVSASAGANRPDCAA